jgi:multidrug efflux system outer membrane protein
MWVSKSLSRLFVATMAGIAAFGCASRPQEIQAPVDLPESFAASGIETAPDRWWTAFGEPELDAVVEQALGTNLDLESAWHRLREAQAVARRDAADLYPTLDAAVDAGWQRPEASNGDQVQLGLFAAYEVDLWGRIGASAEAERLRAAASLADYRATALTLAAEVTRTWIALVETRNQIDLLDRQLEANRGVLASLEVRFSSGLVLAVDVLRQRQLVEATEEQRIAQEGRLAVLEHLLAVLLGRAPRSGTGANARELPPLPPLPNTGLPVNLVQRRPDVEAAYRRLQAADRDLAAAVSARYPRLTLTASATTADDDASDLFDDWIRSLAGSLLAPILRGGELAAEVDRNEAVRAGLLADYGQVSLTALAEVEDALALEASQLRRVASLERQVDLSEASYRRLEAQYLNGFTEFIDVLVAQNSEQRLRRDLLSARRELLEHRVALYRALAGGFETPREAELRLASADVPSAVTEEDVQ